MGRKKKDKMPATADRHKGYQLPARVNQELRRALRDLAKDERRSVSQTVTILLEEALAARGRWPPSVSGEDPS